MRGPSNLAIWPIPYRHRRSPHRGHRNRRPTRLFCTPPRRPSPGRGFSRHSRTRSPLLVGRALVDGSSGSPPVSLRPPSQEADMAFVFSDPFETLFNFQQALDQLRASSWLDAGLSGQGAFPPLNVFRKGDDIVIIAEVPGVKKGDLKIEAKGDTIRIAGSRAAGTQGNA